ncbi:hypothetical protein P8452_50876 [Trifolium repens]|nr:hypothetical protein P8452_50876 [Trifolium repens]
MGGIMTWVMYEVLNVKRLFVLKNKISLSFSGQVTKDKKDANLQMEKESSVKYGEGQWQGMMMFAYGGSLEAQLWDKNYPLGRLLSMLGLSIMDWHGDLDVGCNLQSQIPIAHWTIYKPLRGPI